MNPYEMALANLIDLPTVRQSPPSAPYHQGWTDRDCWRLVGWVALAVSVAAQVLAFLM